jgi:hypothetical protein
VIHIPKTSLKILMDNECRLVHVFFLLVVYKVKIGKSSLFVECIYTRTGCCNAV